MTAMAKTKQGIPSASASWQGRRHTVFIISFFLLFEFCVFLPIVELSKTRRTSKDHVWLHWITAVWPLLLTELNQQQLQRHQQHHKKKKENKSIRYPSSFFYLFIYLFLFTIVNRKNVSLSYLFECFLFFYFLSLVNFIATLTNDYYMVLVVMCHNCCTAANILFSE